MRMLRGVAAALLFVLALVLTGCGSDDANSTAANSTAADSAAANPAADNSTAANSTGENAASSTAAGPALTLDLKGTTGTAHVVAPANDSTPTVKVTTPFAVGQTEVHALREGTGEVVADTATVTVNYVGVNGRTGSVFDSSYEHGSPASFALNQVIPGFAKAIAGQKVGAKVAVAIAPADGYTSGAPDAGIEAGDTLIFVLDVLAAKA